MAIPVTSIFNMEITVQGQAAAAGSNATNSFNVFTYQRTTNVNPVTKAALNTIFQATVIPPLLAAANARYAPVNAMIRNLDDAQDANASFAIAGAGAIATDSTPSDTAVYMLMRTAKRGQSYRGSKHFGMASEVDTLGDVLVGAGLARWQAVQAAVLGNLVDALGNTWVPTVVSRKLSDLTLLPVASVVANQIIAILLNLNIGTMRRRRSITVR